MTTVLKIGIGILPVFVFLAVLVFLDSYKLVRPRAVLSAVAAGAFTAGICYLIVLGIQQMVIIRFELYSRTVAPVIEESLKAVYLVILFRTRKVGFMVDAAIYGFAVGAGFAAVENIDYLIHLEGNGLFFWIIRGFGTAVMHGGTTCIAAILWKTLSERRSSEKIALLLPGWTIAVVIHSAFNHFFLPAPITTAFQLVSLPLIIALIYTRSERILRDWLEIGLDTDVLFLEYITGGQISKTKIGRYLESLKSGFPGEILADMLCYLRIHFELAIRAKGILLMKGAGFGIPEDESIRERFDELEYLEKSIGKTGKLALAPILHTTTRDLWQIYHIRKKR